MSDLAERQALALVLAQARLHHLTDLSTASERLRLAFLRDADAVLAAGYRRTGTGETTVSVEWARKVGPDIYQNQDRAAAELAVKAWGGRVVWRERTRTTHPDRVTDWQEVTP